MKAVLIKHSKKPNTSFILDEHIKPYFDYPMHFHPQFELTYVSSGVGTRFVGDSIQSFSDGDIVLLGKNVPHCWRNSQEYYSPNSNLVAHATVIQFDYNFLGEQFFEAPENYQIKKLLSTENGAFAVKEEYKSSIIEKIEELKLVSNSQRLIILLQILYELALEETTKQVSFGHTATSNQIEIDRLNKVIVYVSENFQDSISLKQISNLVGMNHTSFCKFFKKKYRKSFFEFVNEIRIGFACQKLRENHNTITEICYLSGYNNFSNFSRTFKKLTGLTPSAYLKSSSKSINVKIN